ncbi:MAG: WHG domain-containing protein [Gemmatimonadota bacterium]|nr:WHG domain-containing protein [Gemmatimonadota bacterium]
MVDYALTHEDQYRLIFLMPREAGAQEFPAPPVEAPEDAYSIVQRAVRDAVATGRFAAPITDVDLIAQSLWSTIHGVLALHIVRGQDHWIPWRPARQTAKFLTDHLFEALLVRRPADPPKAKAKSRKGSVARRRKSK